MTEKILIEDLPITNEFIRQKRLIQDRGELALIEDGKSFQHLGYFSLRKGAGYYRGGHFHRRRRDPYRFWPATAGCLRNPHHFSVSQDAARLAPHRGLPFAPRSRVGGLGCCQVNRLGGWKAGGSYQRIPVC